jgi:hypothetical protein
MVLRGKVYGASRKSLWCFMLENRIIPGFLRRLNQE